MAKKGYKFDYWQKENNKQKIFDYITNGHNKSELIEFMNIDRSTFYLWIKEHEDFKELIEKAEDIRRDIICDKLEEKLEEKSLLFNGDFKSIVYMLEHLRPEKWGKKEERFNKDDIPRFIDDIT